MDLPDVLEMEADQITDKKWLVLQYFIDHTGTVQRGATPYQKGIVYPDKRTGKPRFYSYPKRIEEDFEKKIPNSEEVHSDISRTWAMKICQDLTDLGILHYDMFVASRQKHPTEHYYLREDLDAFIQVMRIVFDRTPKSALTCYRYSVDYIQNHIDDDFVCEILARKGAEMRRSLPLWNWSLTESEKVHAIYYARKEKTLWGTETKRIPNLYEQSFESYLTTMMKTLDPQKRSEAPHFPPTISLRLPVFKPGLSEEEQVAILKNLNKKTFEDYPGLELYRSAIHEHYKRYQYDNWILPILSLIRASPEALKEFLFGDWMPYGLKGDCYCFSDAGSHCMNYPLFTFLFTAINDISRLRLVPDERKIPFFRFRPDFRQSYSTESHSALLEIGTDRNLTVCYDASFDTEHFFYGADNGDVWEGDNEQNYEVLTWIEVQSRGIVIKKEDIPDTDTFVQALRDRSSNVSHHIVSKLSHRVQHIIKNYANLPEERGELYRQLLNELNRVIAQPDFYDQRIFSNIVLTDEGKRLVGNTKDMERMISLDFVNYSFFKLNRILLEETYPELIVKSKYFERDSYQLVLR
jgi:hypothetical protein